jgi:TldD protein
MSCTYVAPGAAAPEAILRDTPRGLFVRAIRAGNMDPVTGRIVLIVSEGFLIEAGRRTRRIAETLLSGFARDWLGAIDAIGSDLVFDRGAGNCIKFDQQVPVILGMPTVRAADVRVVSPQGRTP